ncbi:hypothetical protein [Microbacterium sp. CIAB417]|uniref:hypothetical protein n=1 Tax=Microbacterium sp. CIAB417 TaxID=2860287 RepID=UPI001FACEEF7|nr:hypothetical protein [Microbacterium sp. CIAB417]
MHWDRLFEDLEGQLASEWEAERAALEAESERLRISRLGLRERLRALRARDATITVELPAGRTTTGVVEEIGADWFAIADAAPARGTALIPLASVRGIRMDHGALLSSLSPDAAAGAASAVRERMTLGFVVRDLARRRVPLTVEDVDGHRRHGTVDRAGADHLDLALHDAGSPRRAQDVRGHVVIVFASIAAIDVGPH